MNAVLDSDLISFRLMTKDDLGLIMEIENSVYPFPWSTKIFLDCLNVGYLCQVMEIDNEKKIVAYSVMSVAAGESHLLNICVHKDKQGQGYGREMLVHSIHNARRLNASICFLEVRDSNHVASELYHSMGFNQVGTRYNYYPSKKGKEDALIFALQL